MALKILHTLVWSENLMRTRWLLCALEEFWYAQILIGIRRIEEVQTLVLTWPLILIQTVTDSRAFSKSFNSCRLSFSFGLALDLKMHYYDRYARPDKLGWTWVNQGKGVGEPRQTEVNQGKLTWTKANWGEPRQTEVKQGKLRWTKANWGEARQTEVNQGKLRWTKAK